MAYKISNPQRNIQSENNQALVESWINGNRSYVRAKFKTMKHDRKGLFLQEAKEYMNQEDYDDLIKGLHI